MQLWTEKYRPSCVGDYVFRDVGLKNQINQWITEQSIPHVLLTGSPGVGKTTLAKVLLKEIDVSGFDILEINASRNNGVDYIRDTIVNFASMMSFGKFRVILLDEADYLSINAQAALRGVMEQFHETTRFILTANYSHKIIPAIHSRCQAIHIEKLDHVEFTARVATILVTENIEIDLDVLDTYVKISYPDLRKCINLVQQNSIGGKLVLPNDQQSSSQDYKIKMVELFKQGKIREARKLICGSVQPDEMEDIYRFCYQNIELFGDDEDQQDNAILILKQGLIDHAICADAELNLAATMIKLSRIKK